MSDTLVVTPTYVLTGCIVPPATTTALASLTMWANCTDGFNRRNFKLEVGRLSRINENTHKDTVKGEERAERMNLGKGVLLSCPDNLKLTAKNYIK